MFFPVGAVNDTGSPYQSEGNVTVAVSRPVRRSTIAAPAPFRTSAASPVPAQSAISYGPDGQDATS